MDTTDPGLPEFLDTWWVRGGASVRLQDNLSVDGELFGVGDTGIAQGGLFVMQPTWHAYSGAMISSDGDVGVSLRGGFYRGDLSFNLDFRQVTVGQPVLEPDEFAMFRDSYRQAGASLALPVGYGRLMIRLSSNERRGVSRENVGVSYWAPLFNFRGVTGNLSADANYSDAGSWIQRRADASAAWP